MLGWNRGLLVTCGREWRYGWSWDWRCGQGEIIKGLARQGHSDNDNGNKGGQ